MKPESLPRLQQVAKIETSTSCVFFFYLGPSVHRHTFWSHPVPVIVCDNAAVGKGGDGVSQSVGHQWG